MGSRVRRLFRQRSDLEIIGSQAPLNWLTALWARIPIDVMFGIDLRSLALFRIALGVFVLQDLAWRIPDLRVHYTDEGLFPRSLSMTTFSQWRWSVHFVNGTLAFQTFLFFATALIAVLLIVGFQSRLMSILAWALVFSVQSRNPLVLSNSDTLIRVLLFWSMFLPLGVRWSWDAKWMRHHIPTSLPKSTLSVGAAGLLLQIAAMYWFTGAFKWHPTWMTEGSAMYYATGAGQITRPFGDFIHRFPSLLRFLTHGALAIEFIAPIFLFMPFRTSMFRMVGIGAIVSLHLGILVTMDVGMFSWIGPFCMTCFLPAWFWDDCLTVIRARTVQLEIWFGSVSNRLKRQIHSLPQTPGWQFATGHPGKMHTSNASEMDSVTSLLAEPVPQASRKRQPILKGSFIGNILATFCLIFVFAWNISTVTAFTMPRDLRPVAYGLGLYQTWNMFAHPPTATVWYVMQGTLRDGQEINLVPSLTHNDITRVETLTWEEPDNISSSYYRNEAWRKYFTALSNKSRKSQRQRLAVYTCQRWNNYYRDGASLEEIQLYRALRKTQPNAEKGKTQHVLIDTFSCP